MAQTEAVSDHRPAPSPGWAASIGDPGPLGLAGFAGTTFFLSAVNSGQLAAPAAAGVLGLAFFYGGLAQLLAGLFEFIKGNTFGAVAFASFGAFWLSFWYLETHAAAFAADKATPDDVQKSVGTYLLVWTIFTAYMTVASLRTSLAVFAVFLALTITFLFLCIGAYNSDAAGHGATEIGGWLGLITAVLAWYASFAAVTNSTFKKTVLPVFPR